MEAPIDRIRLSQTAKDQLTKIKRSTKIEQWNILCRWAFCLSLAELGIPSTIPLGEADHSQAQENNRTTFSNVEMTWSVFGGENADLLAIALKQRCQQDGLKTDKETLKQQFRLHLHRGISYLAGNTEIRQIEDLVAMATETNQT